MRTLTLMAASLLLAACSTQAPQPVGNDQDAHGCRASAGYQWSPLLGQCVRLFEQAVRLQSLEATETGSASAHVLTAARSLSQDSRRLKDEVSRFLDTVRAA